MRVLYVEDNPANVFLVKRVAKVGKHEIINYIDGGQALKKFDDINPDLVLMDIQLAGDIGGLDVVRELRGRGVQVPIIAVTAYAMVGDKERCLEAGCNDYLAKPLPVPRLVEIFQDYSDKVENAKLKEEPTTPPVEAKPVPATADASSVSADQTKDNETVKEVDKQETLAESSPVPQATENTKQETANTAESTEAKSEVSAETKADSSTESESDNKTAESTEKPPTGKLSEEDTHPVKKAEETEMPKSTSEPSSNT